MWRQVLVLIAVAGCDRGDRRPTPKAAPVTGPAHRVEVAPPSPCRAGEACTVELRLTAVPGFKVNKDYPFKFVPTAIDGVTIDPGVFTHDGAQTGTMTVGFRAAAPGTVRVAGKLRLSVCNDDECRIEEEPVSVDVPVGA